MRKRKLSFEEYLEELFNEYITKCALEDNTPIMTPVKMLRFISRTLNEAYKNFTSVDGETMTCSFANYRYKLTIEEVKDESDN